MLIITTHLVTIVKVNAIIVVDHGLVGNMFLIHECFDFLFNYYERKVVIREQLFQTVDFVVESLPIATDFEGSVEHSFDNTCFIFIRCNAVEVHAIARTS